VYFYWERTSEISYPHSIAIAWNGDIWISASDYEGTWWVNRVYLSTNNGNTWMLKGSLPTGSFSSPQLIAINPVNNYIFCATGFRMFRSTNRGEDWVQVWEYGNELTVAFDNIIITPSGEIYCATYGSVFYSNDNGDTWIEKSNGLPVLSSALGRDGTLYVGTYGYGRAYGVRRSTDGGDTWLAPTNYKDTVVYSLTIADDGSIFAATLGADGHGVLKSTDGGDTWTQVNNGLTGGAFDRIIYNSITKDIFVSAASYNSNVYISTNLGTSWELKNNGIPRYENMPVFAFNPNKGQMFLVITTEYGGVYRTKNYP
jgi:photosystem II stability/assembly factor-like uncharacterized protein